MKIGYYVRNYASKRNIIEKVSDAEYSRVYDLYELPRYSIMLMNKLFGRTLCDPVDFSFRHSGIGIARADLIHFFNAVSFGKVPWVTTFETILPRLRSTLGLHHGAANNGRPMGYSPKVQAAVNAMSSSCCKGLIAMSDCNMRMQVEFLKHFPQQAPKIVEKLHRLYPPQPLLVQKYDDKRDLPTDYLHLMFVGSAFFRKGGLEVIEALSEVRRQVDLDLRLTIVSSMAIDAYATRESAVDVRHARSVIQANNDWITLHGYLPNQRVVELMKSAHIGLLPTHADTFGYSVLEFQAAGCPVITTDVRALPEINDDTIGWVIEVPKNDLGEALYTTASQRQELSDAIRKGLIDIVRGIASDPGQIRAMADRGLENIRLKHSPLGFGEQLREIYQVALAT